MYISKFATNVHVHKTRRKHRVAKSLIKIVCLPSAMKVFVEHIFCLKLRTTLLQKLILYTSPCGKYSSSTAESKALSLSIVWPTSLLHLFIFIISRWYLIKCMNQFSNCKLYFDIFVDLKTLGASAEESYLNLKCFLSCHHNMAHYL